MQFNPDPKKQGNEIIFSWESNTSTYPPVTFNKSIIATCPHQKYQGVSLHSKLDFSINSYCTKNRKVLKDKRTHYKKTLFVC